MPLFLEFSLSDIRFPISQSEERLLFLLPRLPLAYYHLHQIWSAVQKSHLSHIHVIGMDGVRNDNGFTERLFFAAFLFCSSHWIFYLQKKISPQKILLLFRLLSLIQSKIGSTKSRNHLHLLYKVTRPPTNTLISVIALEIGFAFITPQTALIAGLSLPNPFIKLPTPVVINPIPVSAGAIAAVKRTITPMILCVLGGSALNFSKSPAAI